MNNSIFDKTDKGRDEIATRKHQLSPRLRTLLLLIDGSHSSDDLIRRFGPIGLNEHSLGELLNDGYIQQVGVNAAPAPARPAAPAPQPEISDPATSNSDFPIMPDGQNQFQAIYQFYTETIKSTVGLRGYGLQLKVEKASTIEEFRQLRRPYLEAVLKSKGSDIARSLRFRLDELLYYGEAAPPHTTIIGLNTASSE